MKNYAKFIGKFPFSGKIYTRKYVFLLRNSRTEDERNGAYSRLCLCLAILIFGHTIMAIMGVEVYNYNAPTWVKIVSGIFTFVNGAIALAQIQMIYRATFFFAESPYPIIKKVYVDYSGKEQAQMLVVSWSIQILFTWMYWHYR